MGAKEWSANRTRWRRFPTTIPRVLVVLILLPFGRAFAVLRSGIPGKSSPGVLFQGCMKLRIVLLSLCGMRLWAESAPIILKHPVDITAAYGDAVTLRVEAIGPNLGYRWEKLAGKGSPLHQTVGNPLIAWPG